MGVAAAIDVLICNCARQFICVPCILSAGGGAARVCGECARAVESAAYLTMDAAITERAGGRRPLKRSVRCTSSYRAA